MKKERGNIWSNLASKPKGFNFVKGKILTYTYEVPIRVSKSGIHQWDAIEIDRIYIKVKYKNNTEFGYSIIDIDKEQTFSNIKEEIGHNVEFSDEENNFTRDRRLFPFVSSIDIHKNNEEKYRHNRIIKTRKEKIIKLKNKIK